MKIEIEHSVMQQALDALERPRNAQSWYQRSCDDAQAAKALREALAAPQQAQQKRDKSGTDYEKLHAKWRKGRQELSNLTRAHDALLSKFRDQEREALEAPQNQLDDIDVVNMGALPARQSIPGGYVLVPAELSEEMRAAAKPCTTVSALWASIIAAAPNPAPHGITKGT